MSITQLDPGEKLAEANGLTLCYQTFGEPGDAPLALIMGLGAQMIWWDDAFCEMLSQRGFYVVRFDNRDVGKSSRVAAAPPNIARAMAGLETLKAPYTLEDMARDTVGLLDALSIEKAHLVGASMGGMIAQLVAILYPQRVLTLTSIMSTTGEPGLPAPSPEVMTALMAPPPIGGEAYIEANVRMGRLLRNRPDTDEEPQDRKRAARAAARGLNPAGGARQTAAVLVNGSRREALAGVRAPTLVIHGADDPLVPLEAGRATARAIPGAKLLVIERMGHDLPRAAWPQIIDAIAELAGR